MSILKRIVDSDNITAIAAALRNKLGTNNQLSFPGDASSGIIGAINSLVKLPTLSTPAATTDVLPGKEFIDGSGVKKTGAENGNVYKIETGEARYTSEVDEISVTNLSFTPVFAVIYMVAQHTSTLSKMICIGNMGWSNGTDTIYGISRYASASDGLQNMTSNYVTLGSNSVTFGSNQYRTYRGTYRYIIWGR